MGLVPFHHLHQGCWVARVAPAVLHLGPQPKPLFHPCSPSRGAVHTAARSGSGAVWPEAKASFSQSGLRFQSVLNIGWLAVVNRLNLSITGFGGNWQLCFTWSTWMHSRAPPAADSFALFLLIHVQVALSWHGTMVSRSKSTQAMSIYIIYTYINYITSHHITSHCVELHYITLHYIFMYDIIQYMIHYIL